MQVTLFELLEVQLGVGDDVGLPANCRSAKLWHELAFDLLALLAMTLGWAP